MRISAIELRLIELPLVRPFRTSFGTEHVRETLLVRVETPDSEGWGECGADVEPLYSSEFNGAAWTVLEQFFVPRLVGANDVAAIDVAPMLRAFKGHRMAKSAVEMAVLDAELRAEGRSLQDYLGGSGDRVAPGVSVGMTDTVEELLGVVSQHREEGYCRIKLKIEPGFDIEPVRRVRSLLGEGYLLQVDANTAYSRSDGRHLAQLDEFGLLLIEQPLDEEDVVGHAELARQLSTRDLPRRVDPLGTDGRRRDHSRGLPSGQHQGGAGRRIPRSEEDPRRLPRRRSAGLVRGHARDGDRAGRQLGARDPAGFFPAR